jgi:hypothetical protein
LAEKQQQQQKQKQLRGVSPSRPQGVSPGFRAPLVQPLRPFRCASRVGDTPPLAVATPHLRQEAFGICFSNAEYHEAKPKEEIPMSSAAVTVNNPVQSSTYQPKQQQRQTAKEVIAENVKALIAQLEAGKSDALTAYLDAMARFHNYSFGNILAIARQRAVT